MKSINILKNFWKGSEHKKPLYRIPLFWLVSLIVVAGIFYGGYYFGNQGKKTEPTKTVRVIEDQIGLAEASKTKTPAPSTSSTASAIPNVAVKASASVTSNEFTGWSGFEDRAIGVRLYYPANWMAEKVDGKNIIAVHTGDDKYYLYFGLRKKGEKVEIQAKNNLPSGDDKEEGRITIVGTSIDKYKIVKDDMVKAYLYPKNITQTADGKWEFAASFVPSTLKSDPNTDFEVLDERIIGEKILKSVEIVE